MDIARGGHIKTRSTNHWRGEALNLGFEIYDQLDDSALSSACDQVSAHTPAFYDGMQTCFPYKRHETWKSMVTRTECSVRAVARCWVESLGHDSGISPIVSECRKLSVLSDDAEPCCFFVILVKYFLFSGSCLDLQDSLDFL